MKTTLRTISVILLAGAASASADVSLTSLFGHNMVLQRDMPVPVWGRAAPGEPVTVNFGSVTAKTVAGTDGKWSVRLPALKADAAGMPLVIAGANTLTFTNVLVGDVWLCSGQSNMEYGYRSLAKPEQIVDPQIRTFCVLKSASLTPLEETMFIRPEIGLDTGMGHWQLNNPAGPWGGFSAVGYFFGRAIHKQTGVPVGLIGSYWGGTPAQAWTSLEGLQSVPSLTNHVNGVMTLNPNVKRKFPVRWEDYVVAMKKWDKEARIPYEQSRREWERAVREAKTAGKPAPPEPRMAFPRPQDPGCVGVATTLFNGMINPLIPFAIKGVVWYQGESNANDGKGYGVLFPAMIRDWRRRWGQGDFPFCFVSVAGFEVPTNNPSRGLWAALREGQAQALSLPNTGMAVAIDVGARHDIHPTNKVAVAERLARVARRVAYGEDLVSDGPTFAALAVKGARIEVTFDHAGSGLVWGRGNADREGFGFEVAGTNRQWFAATADIAGTHVVVGSDQVPAPVAVRYAWDDYPPCRLYNQEGLPAVPFRTDDWSPRATAP